MKESIPSIKMFASEDIRSELHIEHNTDTPEFKKRVETFCREVLISENRLDSGNFAHVFAKEDTYEGLCFKKLKPLTEPYNSVHEEGKILNHIRGFRSDLVRIPVAHLSAEQYATDSNGKTVKRRLLVMEKIDGVSLRDVFAPELESRRKELPKNFNPKEYFSSLKSFFEVLHSEKGVYHRDVSMGNLMIDMHGRPVVIDFGESFWGDAEEGFDQYGRHSNAVGNKDVDLKKLSLIEEQILKILDKN